MILLAAVLTVDYRTEQFDFSPVACYIPGSHSVVGLQECRPAFRPERRPGSIYAEYPKALSRVLTVKKVAKPANESLPKVHRMVKDGLRLTAHLEDLQTMLANNADLYTLVGRGEGAVRGG